MNITVLGEVYNVSEPVGRKFSMLMAEGVDELVAAREAVANPIVDKSWHEPKPDPTTTALLDTIKTLLERPVPAITVTSPDITVPVTVETADGTKSEVYVSNASTASFTEAIHELTELMRAPKRQSILRDAAGRIIGIES